MSDNLKGFWVARQLRERGLLLELLRDETDYVDSHVVRFAMAHLGTPIPANLYDRHIDYLREKGYIHVLHKQMGHAKTQLVKISAQGRDLMSGLLDDPGVGTTEASPVPGE